MNRVSIQTDCCHNLEFERKLFLHAIRGSDYLAVPVG